MSGGSQFVSRSSVSENKLQGEVPKRASHSIVPSRKISISRAHHLCSSYFPANKFVQQPTHPNVLFNIQHVAESFADPLASYPLMEGRLDKEFYPRSRIEFWFHQRNQSFFQTQATVIYKKQHPRRIPRRHPRTLQPGANRCAYIGNSSPPSRLVGS